MIDSATTTNVFGASNAGKSAGTTTADKTSKPVASDFETFLRMMTVQMQNQDPLNPIDSADYAVQLATFSGVEQQVRTNQLLADMASQFTLSGMAQLAGWIGQEARSSAAVGYNGTPTKVNYAADTMADRAVLVVKDASGAVLSREEVPHDAKEYLWMGADMAGDPLPEGAYQLSLESYQDGALIGSTPVEGYALVTEVRSGADGPTLILQGGASTPASGVTALRRAG